MPLQTYNHSTTQNSPITTIASDYLGVTQPSQTMGAVSALSQDSFLKKTAIAALISFPTMIQPVFASPQETVILSNGLSHQPAYIYSNLSQKEFIYSDSLNSVLENYVIKDQNAVKHYISHNDDLLNFIGFAARKLHRVEYISSVELELYHDSEENWEKLFIVVNTELDDMDEIDQLETSLFYSIFEPQIALLSGRVVLSVG